MKHKIAFLALALALTLLPAATALAADTQQVDSTGVATIPITLTAEPMTFSVTLPTRFALAVGTEGEVFTSEAKIVNNSAGPVAVTKIEVRGAGGWSLAGYRDLGGEDVDSNRIGFSLSPADGRNGTKANAALVTTDGGGNAQILLSAKNDDWIIDAQNDGDTDELTIAYDAFVTPVSKTVNQQVAEIVITIGWNTAV